MFRVPKTNKKLRKENMYKHKPSKKTKMKQNKYFRLSKERNYARGWKEKVNKEKGS